MLATMALILMGLVVAGCTGGPTKSTTSTGAAAGGTAGAGEVSRDKPLVVDKAKGEIKIYAEVNRKYVSEPTRHGIVWDGGSNVDMAVFRSFAPTLDIYKALVDLGGKPGDNVTLESPLGTKSQGTELKYTVTWGGKTYDMNDLIASTGKLGGKPLVPRFGGNKVLQTKANTGCILCLDTCAAGITSNSSVGWKSFDSKLIEFRGVGDKLPEDGKPVTVTITLQ